MKTTLNSGKEFSGGLQLWSTVGEYMWSEWYVGKHTQRTFSRPNIPMEWLVNDCWTHAYSNDHFRHKTKGSLDLLKQVVLGGKRVRVHIDSYNIDADSLNIRNGHLSAQLLGQLSKLSLMTSLLKLIRFGKLHLQQVMLKLLDMVLEGLNTKAIRLIKSQSRGLLSQGHSLSCFLQPEQVLLHVDLKLF